MHGDYVFLCSILTYFDRNFPFLGDSNIACRYLQIAGFTIVDGGPFFTPNSGSFKTYM